MSDRITRMPGMRSGKPTIRGTRLTVSDVLDWLAAGMSQAEILDEYSIENEDITAALDWAKDGVNEVPVEVSADSWAYLRAIEEVERLRGEVERLSRTATDD